MERVVTGYTFTGFVMSIVLLLGEVVNKLFRRSGKCLSKEKMNGKTVIITGGGTGIGYQTALELARRGARVILAVLYVDEANAARDKIIKKTGNKSVEVKYLDVSSIKSIRLFTEDICRTEHKLDVLINNAGIAGMRGFTEEGLVKVMATNYIGPFMLTHLLMGLLLKTPGSRVINMASVAYAIITESSLSPLTQDIFMSYSYSKLYLILFTREMARRIQGSGVTVNAVHPGVVGTTGIWDFLPLKMDVLLSPLLRLLYKNAEEGAQTSIYLAVSDEVKDASGKYFEDCRESETFKVARDMDTAKELWRKTEQLVGLKKEENLLNVIRNMTPAH